MTSTHITIGLTEDGRSSSRVIKPPGGGHTDIFGGQEDKKIRGRDNGRNASSILEGTNVEQPQTQAAPTRDNSNPQPLPQPKNDPPVVSTRGRVPPGGFSSGLW